MKQIYQSVEPANHILSLHKQILLLFLETLRKKHVKSTYALPQFSNHFLILTQTNQLIFPICCTASTWKKKYRTSHLPATSSLTPCDICLNFPVLAVAPQIGLKRLRSSKQHCDAATISNAILKKLRFACGWMDLNFISGMNLIPGTRGGLLGYLMIFSLNKFHLILAYS